jgi:DNA helicase II / ATP-dependent DNA helicase PcrA
MADLLSGLNQAQQAAVSAGTGPVLVLAGPGSGKTRVLTHRIAYLVSQMNVQPEQIVAVTFTNKAATEMRTRAQALLDSTTRGLRVGTFHAICAQLLRREHAHVGFARDFAIYDTDDQLKLITQIYGTLNIDPKRYPIRQVLNSISGAKNELMPAKDYPTDSYFNQIVAKVYPQYQTLLEANNAMDFDDLLMRFALLLRGEATIRAKYQQLFEYILVDEFQDTNTAQYTLVKLLAAPQNNAFVVGDEDQAIYAFRGADYRNVLQFRRDFPSAKVVLLEQNYRSTQVVLDVARAVIDRNKNRTPKALFTDRTGGDTVTIYEAFDEKDEARFVLEKIREWRAKHRLPLNDFAVLYRTNMQSRILEEAFVKANMPYRLVGGVNFYKRQEIKDLLAYLRLVQNPNDTISFERAINTPKRGIGKKSQEDFLAWVAKNNLTISAAMEHLQVGKPHTLGTKAKDFVKFYQLLLDMRAIADTDGLATMFDALQHRIGFAIYLNEISETPEQAQERAENIDQMRAKIADNPELTLIDFLEEAALVADVAVEKPDADSVTLLTLHAAKGLEYAVVFLVGLEDGILPHRNSRDEVGGLEEERRLFYVGITRAERKVFISYAFRRAMYGMSEASIPSAFLLDIPQQSTDGVSTVMRQAIQQHRFTSQTTWDTPKAAAPPPSSFQTKRPTHTPANGGSSGMDRSALPSYLQGKVTAFTPAPKDTETKYKVGMRVKHTKFGMGTVRAVKLAKDDEEVTVLFDDKRERTLLASYGLSIVSGGGSAASAPTAPPRPTSATPPRTATTAPAKAPARGKYPPNSRVRHDKYGDGVVISSKITTADEEVIVVFNGDGQERKFFASFGSLKIIKG